MPPVKAILLSAALLASWVQASAEAAAPRRHSFRGYRAQGDAAHCPAPRAWGARSERPGAIPPVRNTIALDAAGGLYWDGAPVALPILARYLDLTKQMKPVPHLRLWVSRAASCSKMKEIVALIDSADPDCIRLCTFELGVSRPRGW